MVQQIQKQVYLVQLNFLVVFCSTNLKASYLQLKDRVHTSDLKDLKSYAQVTRIMKNESIIKFNSDTGLSYSIVKMPLYTKHTKLIT